MPLKPISDDLIEQVARIIDGYAFDARYRLKRQSRQWTPSTAISIAIWTHRWRIEPHCLPAITGRKTDE
jgi:hypothetical protein